MFTSINFVALQHLYMPFFEQHFKVAKTLNLMIKNWKTVFFVYNGLLFCLIKQWWQNTCVEMSKEVYLIHHIIQGKSVKFMIKMGENVENVTDVDGKQSFMQEVHPFLRFKVLLFNPSMIGETQSLLIHKKSGTEICD